MMRLAFVIVLCAACTDHASGTTNEPVLSGNTCQIHTDSTTCIADADCAWLGTGCACPENDPSCTCSPGSCIGKMSEQGSGSGSGTTTAACACPNSEVCYEQVGGTAQMAGTGPMIACTLPTSGSGDPCSRVTGEGTCTDSTTVSGLCVCDNGIR